MLKKKITFMLIPGTTGISRQVSFPIWMIYASFFTVIILLTSSFYFSSAFFSNKVDEYEVEKLRAENKELLDKYEQMRWNIAELENRFENLIDKEIKIRHLFNLPEIDSDERRLGTGGPISPALAHMTTGEMAAHLTEMEVDRLLKLSNFELEKYTEVENSLIDIKDQLQHTPSIKPCQGWYNGKFGMRDDPFTGYRRMHRGIDISGPLGTPIIAPAEGIVKSVTSNNDLGKMIVIDHGYGYKTRYGHLSKINVKQGQRIKRGDIIGKMGATGYATGSHLHYEIIKNGNFVNPRNFILN